VEERSQVLGVAAQTPPYDLVLSHIKDWQGIELIVHNLLSQTDSLPGVMGLITEANAFAQAWHYETGQTYDLVMQLRIHQLKSVQPVRRSKGRLRLATTADRSLLMRWMEDFLVEAMGSVLEDLEQTVDRHLRQNTLYLWQDPHPVSLVCVGGSTPNGQRIWPVYTPPEYRKQGYATTAVAELSQLLLDQGNRFCFLFTDLANPTANHIYQTIGYQPICDWQNYRFR
jgi:hypothetical protein